MNLWLFIWKSLPIEWQGSSSHTPEMDKQGARTFYFSSKLEGRGKILSTWYWNGTVKINIKMVQSQGRVMGGEWGQVYLNNKNFLKIWSNQSNTLHNHCRHWPQFHCWECYYMGFSALAMAMKTCKQTCYVVVKSPERRAREGRFSVTLVAAVSLACSATKLNSFSSLPPLLSYPTYALKSGYSWGNE